MHAGHHRFGWLIPAALVVACGQNDVLVVVHVQGRSPEVTSLAVTASIDGRQTTSMGAPIRQDLDRFYVELDPGDGSGKQRRLNFQVSGLGADGCQLALGTGQGTIGDTGRYDLTVSLSQNEQTRGCHLTVTKVGDGGGKVTVQPGGKVCDFSQPGASGTCDGGYYPLGQQVSVTAVPDATAYPGSLFGGYSGACVARDETCRVTIGEQTASVRVGLLPRKTCNGDHVCWENPLPHGINLQAIWGSSSEDAWAVGDGGLIQHWNGQFWAQFNSGATADLTGVWGSGPDDVWAVGDVGTVIHWDGQAWTPGDSGTRLPFEAIWGSAPNDVWTVGVSGVTMPDGTCCVYQGVVGHWDGEAWTVNKVDTTAGLKGIWGSGRDDIWAVGEITSLDSESILHWDGKAWTPIPGVTWDLGAVWGSGRDDVWAVGPNAALHWDGKTWTSHDVSDIGFPKALWGSGSYDIWAAGSGEVHWDGNTWSAANRGTFAGVWGSGPDDVWAVGEDGDVEHWDGQAWTSRRATISGATFVNMWANSPDDIWGVGAGGAALHWNGQFWRFLDSGSSDDLGGVWSSGREVWAVGGSTIGKNDGTCCLYNGTIVHWDGFQWTSVDLGSSLLLTGVWGSGTDDIWAVGTEPEKNVGAIMHWDGTTWTRVDSGTTAILSAVWGSGPNDVWAVGEEIVHWDGARWSIRDGGMQVYLQRVWGSGPDDVWAVGGDAIHWDGKSWIRIDTGSINVGLSAVSGSGPRDVWVVGDNKALHWDGRAWTSVITIPVNTSTPVFSVLASEANDVWFSGGSGSIFRYHPSP